MAKSDGGKRGQCRIIAGKWRGRNIKFDDAEGLRPTTDRIRETVFNWLQSYIPQSRCLDCFAGSGVLGFEALSRGAAEVIFIEKNIKTVRNLKANISQLGAGNVTIHHADALTWLQSQGKLVRQSNKLFDLVFIDPPFHSDLLVKCCNALVNCGCLAEDAIIYVEHEAGLEPDLPENWCCLKEKKAGQVSYKLLEQRVMEK